jgi:hypothetical protein
LNRREIEVKECRERVLKGTERGRECDATAKNAECRARIR